VDIAGILRAPMTMNESILIGEKDNWMPVEPCRKMATAAQQAG